MERIPEEVLEGARKVGEGRKAFRKMLEELVQKAGYKISLSTPNAYAIPTSHKEISIDRKVLLACRG